MNRRLLSILAMAFVVAAVCAFMVAKVAGPKMGQAAPPSNTVKVVAAAVDLKLGTLITPANLTTVEMVAPLPKGAITNPELVKGRGVIADIFQGEPILESRLAPVGSGGGLAATIPDGMRACAVRVDEVVGVAGFVTPGMRVDILISGIPPSELNAATTTGQKVKTLLQNIQVLSAGTDYSKDAEGKPKPVQVVNLLVTPDQAEILSLASSQTHIQLVLRNPLDTQIATTSGTMVSNLFEDKNTPHPVAKVRSAAPAVKRAEPSGFNIEVINGTAKSSQKFGTPGGNQ